MVPNTPTNLLDLRQLGLLLAVLTEIPRMDKADILGLVRLRLRYLRSIGTRITKAAATPPKQIPAIAPAFKGNFPEGDSVETPVPAADAIEEVLFSVINLEKGS